MIPSVGSGVATHTRSSSVWRRISFTPGITEYTVNIPTTWSSSKIKVVIMHKNLADGAAVEACLARLNHTDPSSSRTSKYANEHSDLLVLY